MFPIIPNHLPSKSAISDQLRVKSFKTLSDHQRPFKIDDIIASSTTPTPRQSLQFTITGTTTTTTITSIINSNSNCGVFGVNLLPKNSISSHLESSSILGSEVISSRINLKLKNGFLQATNGTAGWLKCVKISSDVHSYNALLEISANESILQVRLVKDIPGNEELTLWFSEEVIRLMSLSFLTPQNIQGINFILLRVEMNDFN